MITKHQFYFETSLYKEIPREQIEDIEDFFSGDVDAYSALNQTETTYKIVQSEIVTKYDYDNNVNIGYFLITLTCKRKLYDVLRFFIYKGANIISKVGQNPSLADLQFAEIDMKYNKVLPAEDLKNLKKAIGLVSHGAGAGSFVYIRRIFEKLVLEAFKSNAKNLEKTESEFKVMRMTDKIELLREYLPSQLIEMKNIYSILGKGVHELTEQECLKYFSPIKLSIELILDQKIEEDKKKERDKIVKQQLQDIQKELTENKNSVEEKTNEK